MGFGFGGGCECSRCNGHRERPRREEQTVNVNNGNNPELLQFLRTLAPGTCLVIQYDCQPPTSAVFQGFQGNNIIILSDFDCFPGLARIVINKINVVSVNSSDCSDICCKRKRYQEGEHHNICEEYEL